MPYRWKPLGPHIQQYVDEDTGEPVGSVLECGPYPGLGTYYVLQGEGLTNPEGGYPTKSTAKTALAMQVARLASSNDRPHD